MKALLYQDSRPGPEAEGPRTARGHSSCMEPQASLPCLSQPHPDPDPARIQHPSADAGPLGLLQYPFQGPCFPWVRDRALQARSAFPEEASVDRGQGWEPAPGRPSTGLQRPPGKSWKGILLSSLEYTAKNHSPLLLS